LLLRVNVCVQCYDDICFCVVLTDTTRRFYY
jgi:hypothetical protein